MNLKKLGRYEIIGELGHGAMGTVFKAIDPLIERTVAIKTINLDLSKEELATFEERFYREAKSAGKLNHPNIVTIYDVGESDNTAYIAMEFLEGQSLRQVLDSGTVLPLDRIIKIIFQVASGLAYAQEHNIVHRDIKPANIVITKTGITKITDFGIAHMPSGSRTMAGMVMGSPKYMSPEQVVGKQVDGRSDIFSLGVVLYEMLTGRSPFDGDNISTIMYRILNEIPPSPHSLNPSIPETFDWIIAKALSKHPDDRYQTAREFAEELRRHKSLLKPSNYIASHGTLERRKKPRINDGDTTQLLQRMAGGDPTATGISQPDRAKNIAEENASSAPRLNNFLYGGMAILLLAVVATIFLGKSEPGKPSAVGKPSQITKSNEAPAPAPTDSQPPKMEIKLAPLPDAPETPPPSGKQADTKDAAVEPPKPEKHTPSQPSKTPKSTSKMTAMSNSQVNEESGASQTGSGEIEEGQESVLAFAVTPWGEIYLDGKKIGISPPLKELKIKSGKHRIEIRNEGSKSFIQTMQISPGETRKIKHKFN